MSEFIARKLVSRMIIHDVINHDKREEYLYTIQLLIEKYVSFLLTYIVAIISGTLVETTLFLLTFILIRKYAGGYHCSSDIECIIMSLLFVLFSVLVEAPFLVAHSIIANIIFIIMTVFILYIGSVNHPDMCWSKYEFEKSKRSSHRMVIIWIALLFCFAILGMPYKILIYFIVGIINASFSVMIAKILKQEVRNYDEEC